jgi:hypothetical protein
MLHCHNLYHMESGMARVVRYDSYSMTPEQEHLDHNDHHLHDHWYTKGLLGAGTHKFEAAFRLSQTWNEFEGNVDFLKIENWRAEGDIVYRRWFSNYFDIMAGGTFVAQDHRAQLGIGYILPLLIHSQVFVDHKGKWRVDLAKHFQWTTLFKSELIYKWRQEQEWGSEIFASLVYAPDWHWSVGLQYTGHSLDTGLGIGLQYQF